MSTLAEFCSLSTGWETFIYTLTQTADGVAECFRYIEAVCVSEETNKYLQHPTKVLQQIPTGVVTFKATESGGGWDRQRWCGYEVPRYWVLSPKHGWDLVPRKGNANRALRGQPYFSLIRGGVRD